MQGLIFTAVSEAEESLCLTVQTIEPFLDVRPTEQLSEYSELEY